MKTLSAREYLGQLQELDTNINQDLERLDDMKINACSTGAIDYSAERVQTSPSGDSLCKAVTNYVAFNDESMQRLTAFQMPRNRSSSRLEVYTMQGIHRYYSKVYVQFKSLKLHQVNGYVISVCQESSQKGTYKI